MKSDVAVLNFGIGNVSSVMRACKFLGFNTTLTDEPNIILEANRLIVPGDGAYGGTMQELSRHNLINPILKFANSGRPLLGICVGMQILADFGEEFGRHEGLKLIPGKVVKFEDKKGVKVPQIGWNQLKKPEKISWENTLLNKNSPGDWVYFVHSFIFIPNSTTNVIATTKYGNQVYCSMVKKDNITGTQFHPEKSGSVGLKILKQFLADN